MNKVKGLMGPLPHTTIDQAMETAHRMWEHYTSHKDPNAELMLYVMKGDMRALPFISVLGVADSETRQGVAEDEEIIAFRDAGTLSPLHEGNWYRKGRTMNKPALSSDHILDALVDVYEAERASSPQWYISPLDDLLKYVKAKDVWKLFTSGKVKV